LFLCNEPLDPQVVLLSLNYLIQVRNLQLARLIQPRYLQIESGLKIF
jgi:hypothetical protein